MPADIARTPLRGKPKRRRRFALPPHSKDCPGALGAFSSHTWCFLPLALGMLGLQSGAMKLSEFMAEQLRKPSGRFGSHVMARLFHLFSGRMVRITIDVLQPALTDSVLDIGFGNGDSLLLLAERARRGNVTGVDFSSEMVRKAMRLVKKAGANRIVTACLGDAACLPFDSGVFDKAMSINTAYFWPDLRAVFGEIARVLKPGGLFAISVRPPAELRRAPYSRHGFSLYDSSDIVEAMRDCGMRVILVERFDEDRKLSQIVVMGERQDAA